MSSKQRVECIEARTLASVREGNILEVTSKGSLRTGSGTPTQIITVDIWSAGDLIDQGVKLIVPLRLSGNDLPFAKGSVVVFLGKAFPKSMAGRERDWCWNTFTVTTNSPSKSSAAAKELSTLSLKKLKAKFERGNLDKFKAGTILSLWSVKVSTNKETSENYAIVRYSTEIEAKNGESELEEGEITMPGRFIDQLTAPNALPCIVLYEGKRKNSKGNREFHDVHFIDGNDSRVQALINGHDSVDFIVQKVEENNGAMKPIRSSDDAAGYDLHCNSAFSILPWSRALVTTGLRFFLPHSTYARLAPRSGLASHGIDIAAGVVDRDYRGEVKVLVVNNSSKDFHCSSGARICQVILERIISPSVRLLEANNAASTLATGRKDLGFGQFSGCY